MSERVASLYVEIGADASGVTSALTAVRSDLLNTESSASKFSTTFNDVFIAGMNQGSATLQDFGQILMQTASTMGLGTGQLSRMAQATGIWTDQQVLAGRAAANVAAKAQELAGAVARGEMTAREAGQAFREYAESQVVAASSGQQFADVVAAVTGVVAKMAAAAAVTGAALKQAFDLGEQGAEVLQVEASFNTLLQTLGGAPDTLNQMRAAAQGAVSDLELMSAANTLLIGTTGELGGALANAIPQLVAIAQAAHTLNPALGSTTFLFDSLARGLKRGSPLILDNLGIIVNLTDVYNQYADQLGTTADQLTEAEKTQALLNEVLAQGQVIIEQAGEASLGYTERIDRMQASLSNAANALKGEFAPAIANAADAVTYLLTGTDQINNALSAHAAEVSRTSVTYSEYSAELDRAANVAGYMVDAEGNLVRIHRTSVGATQEVVQANYRLTQSAWATARALEAGAAGADEIAGGLSRLDDIASGVSLTLHSVGEAAGMSAEQWQVYGERLTAAAEATGYFDVLAAGLAAGIRGELQTATDNYVASLAELIAEQEDLQAQLLELQESGYSPTSEKVQELTQAIQENADAQTQALAALQAATAEMIYQQASAGLDTQASLDLARAMGVLSEADYAVATAVAQLRTEFDKNRDGMISASEGAAQYAASIDLLNRAVLSLQQKNLPVTLDNIAAEMANIAEADASNELQGTADTASDAAPELEGVAAAAEEAAQQTGDLASTTEEQNDALRAVQSAANTARSGLSTLKGALRDVLGPLRDAGGAARDLGDGLRDIPRNVSINVSTSGFPQAIQWVKDLSAALNSVPTSITATITLNSQQSGSQGGGSGSSGGSGGGGQGPRSQVTVNNTYNVYDPLAAAILARQTEVAFRNNYEALMNG